MALMVCGIIEMLPMLFLPQADIMMACSILILLSLADRYCKYIEKCAEYLETGDEELGKEIQREALGNFVELALSILLIYTIRFLVKAYTGPESSGGSGGEPSGTGEPSGEVKPGEVKPGEEISGGEIPGVESGKISVDDFIKNNVNPNFQQNVKEAFMDDVKVTVLEQDVTVYRYHGGSSQGTSYWYTPNQTSNPAADLALPQGNTYQYMDTYIIPRGTTILEGTVAPNFGQPGGGYQFYVPNPSVVIKQ